MALITPKIDHIHTGIYYNEEDDPLSAHMFALDGEKWKKLRKKFAPTFSLAKMKFVFPTMAAMGERFRDHLLKMVQHCEELEFKELCARFTTDINGTCAFGVECNSLNDPNTEFRQYGQQIFGKPRHGPMVSAFLQGYKEIGRKLRFKVMLDDVSTFFMTVVRETVEYREANNIRQNDFMDILINMKIQEKNTHEKPITMDEIATHAFGFFFAAFETSSTALTFCLYELALNQQVQSNARQIIRTALQKYDGQFSYEMMMDMSYIDQILQGKKFVVCDFADENTN